MFRITFAASALALAGVAATAQPQPAASARPPIDRGVLHVQVILDKLGFGPGILDGRGGPSSMRSRAFRRAAG